MANEGDSQIELFPLQVNQQPQEGLITAGIDRPWGLWSDNAASLYVANQGNNTVTKYPFDTTTPAVTYSQGLSRPLYPIVDGTGDLFVGNAGNGTIVEYKAGSTSAYQILKTPGVEVDGLAFDQQGNLYAAYRPTGHPELSRIAEFSAGSTRGRTLAMTVNSPQGLIVDASGNIVVAVTGGPNSIEVFSPDSKTPSVTLPMPNRQPPTQLAIDNAQQYLYVSSDRGDTVYAIAYPFSGNSMFVKDRGTGANQGVITSNNRTP
jgi:sugar lactone lactonase YvrE